MSQEQKAAVEAVLREVPLDPTGDLEVQRPLFEEFMRQVPLPDDVTLTDGMFFHGGVFALGSARASVPLAVLLGRQALDESEAAVARTAAFLQAHLVV